MSDEVPPYWFRAKRYGYGWGLPATKQGWAVFGGFLALIFGPLVLGGSQRGPLALAGLAIGTPLLVWVCYRKGEPPRWRWGTDASPGERRR